MDVLELIWIAAAFLSGLIVSKLSLPPMVGYLIAGYVLHAAQIAPLQSLSHLADIGIQLLLFTVGLKLKPSLLLRQEVLTVGGLHVLLMAIVSGLVFFWLQQQVTGGFLLGISLAFSSTVFAIKALEDSGELSSLHGRDILSILILQDIVAVALLAWTEGKEASPWALAIFLLPLLRPLAHRLLSACQNSELHLLLGVSMAISGGVLAEKLNVTADIGALLTGLMLAHHSKTEELSNRLWSLKELFLVAFFLQIGLNELPNRDQLYQALMLLALLPLQGIMFFVLYLISGLRVRTAFISSLSLTTYSEFALITTKAITDAGLLGTEWQAIISVAVAGSLALAAPLNRYSQALFVLLEPYLMRFERQSDHPDALPISLGDAEWLIIGMGRTGVAAYHSLVKQNQHVIGLDADPTVLETQLALGNRVIYADVGDNELWAHVHLQTIKGVILTLPSFENRLNAIGQLRKRQFQGVIGTICYLVDDENLLKQQGASFVIHPLVEAGTQLAKQMLIKAD